MSSSSLRQVIPPSENWNGKLDNNGAHNQLTNIFDKTQQTSFSQSLESLLARSDIITQGDGLNVSRAAPTTVTGSSVTFEELINSENAQIREFAVLDQQPLSPDWAVLKTLHPVTPSNFKAIYGLSDGVMLSQRFANAIYAV